MPRKRHKDDNSSAEEGEISEESDYEARPKKKKSDKKEKPKADKGKKGKAKAGSDDGSDADSDHSEFQFEYDDEGYRDDDDRGQLWELPEIERERILAERLEKRDSAKERWELKRKLERARRGRVQAGASEDRGKRRTEAKKADRRMAALDDIRKRKDSRKEQRRGGEEEEEEEEARSSPERSPSRRSPERGRERERERRERETTPPPPKEVEDLFKDEREGEGEGSQPAELEDLEKIRLTRDQLEKWVYEPFFDELVRGLFVRFGMGIRDGRATYRIMEIEGVAEYRKVYTLGKSPTQKGLLLRGFNNSRVSPMEYVSNKPFTQDEFGRYSKLAEAMRQQGGPGRITREEVAARRRKIDEAKEHVYTEEEIQARLRAKEAVGAKPRNLAAERSALTAMLEEAKGSTDEDGLRRLEALTEKMEELEREIALRRRAAAAGGGSSLTGAASINEKAKEENFRRQLMADKQKAEEEAKKRAQGGSSKLDPFSRRPCAPTAITIFSKQKRERVERERAEKEKSEKGAEAADGRKSVSPSPPSAEPAPGSTSPAPLPTDRPAAPPAGRASTGAAAAPRAATAGSALLSAHASIDIDIRIDPPGPSSSATTFRPVVARQSPVPSAPAAGAPGAAPAAGAAPAGGVKKLSIQDYRRRAGV